MSKCEQMMIGYVKDIAKFSVCIIGFCILSFFFVLFLSWKLHPMLDKTLVVVKLK